MELERCVCKQCGEPHELCRCYEIREDYMFQLEAENLKKLYYPEEKENDFPKIMGNEVEVSEGVIISKQQYEMLYMRR